MNWISLILQIVTLRKSQQELHSLIESSKNMAERGKRAVVSMLVLAVAALFFFSGLLISVIDFGLQLDKGGSVSFSGLQVSGTILGGIGFLLLAVGLLLGRMSPAPVESIRKSSTQREDRIKDILEEFLAAFLTRMMAKGEEKPKEAKPD